MGTKQQATPHSLAPMPIPFLRAWRLERGMTQAQLARRAHVARATIVTAEQGRPVWRATAARLARAIGVDARALSGTGPNQVENSRA